MYKKLWHFIKKNKYFIFIFVLATIYFLIQKYKAFSWDFIAYADNAKYILGGSYLELLRPPLMPLILSFFYLLSLGEYFYIVFVSAIFAFSVYKLSKLLDFKADQLYLLFMTPYFLFFALLNGTELLSLSFFILYLYCIFKDKEYSGFFIAFAVLLRYNFLPFVILLLLHKNNKKRILSFIYFFIAFFPWLLYNKLAFGNYFLSMADSYTLNIIHRQYMLKYLSFFDIFKLIFEISFVLFPFFIIGILEFIYKCFKYKKEFLKKYIFDILMIFISVFSFYSYTGIPHKQIRYLFLLTLPVAYFSYKGIYFLVNYFKKYSKEIKFVSFLLIFIVFFMSSAVILYHTKKDDKGIYLEAKNKIYELGLQNCALFSNAWVFDNYYGLTAKPFLKKKDLQKNLDKGAVILLYKGFGEPAYAEDLSYLKTLNANIYDYNKFLIIHKKDCMKKEKKVVYIFLREFLNKEDNFKFSKEPCDYIFNNSFFRKMCYFIN